MTPPISMVSVPPNVLESIAFNLCSLHDFDPAFVQQNEKFALATIMEYLRAQPTAAPVREEGGAVPDSAWVKFANDFNAMTDEQIEDVSRDEQAKLEEAEDWLEAVATWRAAGSPRRKGEK